MFFICTSVWKGKCMGIAKACFLYRMNIYRIISKLFEQKFRVCLPFFFALVRFSLNRSWKATCVLPSVCVRESTYFFFLLHRSLARYVLFKFVVAIFVLFPSIFFWQSGIQISKIDFIHSLKLFGERVRLRDSMLEKDIFSCLSLV